MRKWLLIQYDKRFHLPVIIGRYFTPEGAERAARRERAFMGSAGHYWRVAGPAR